MNMFLKTKKGCPQERTAQLTLTSGILVNLYFKFHNCFRTVWSKS